MQVSFEKGMAMIPLIFIIAGSILVTFAIGSTLYLQTVVSFGVGPYNSTIIGLSPLSAILLFSGLALLAMGTVTYVSMLKLAH